MLITVKDAEDLLKEAEGVKKEHIRWIKHSYAVGETAKKIALALNLDGDYAKTLGLIHDIGKMYGTIMTHDLDGYELLTSRGYDKNMAYICLTHSFLNNDVSCTAGRIPENNEFRNEFIKNHEYTLYERIINLCDLMCTDHVMTLEQRLIELAIRKGIYENTKYHLEEALKLKNEIQELLGFNLYKLFPEVIDNL